MTQIAYTVFCTIRYKTMEQDWLDWMQNGHIAEVIQCGASGAELIRHDPETEGQSSMTYEIRYKFDSRGKFEEYLEQHAPRLRRDGYERFPVEDGFQYRRTVGEIIS